MKSERAYARPGMLDRDRQDRARASGGRSSKGLDQRIMFEVDARSLGGDALDFGAGTGALSQRLLWAGRFETIVAVDLIEYDGRPQAPQLRWLRHDLNEPLPLSDSSFDLVAGVGILESLENPWAVAREWFRLLRPGGVAIATVPNIGSWRSLASLVLRHHFLGLGQADTYALTAFSRIDLARLFRAAGFVDMHLFFGDVGLVPRTQLTWQSLSRCRLRGLRYSDDVGCVARKPMISSARP